VTMVEAVVRVVIATPLSVKQRVVVEAQNLL
jgi:hypothetical protein